MIDDDAILGSICGPQRVQTFKTVKLTSMLIGRVVKQIVAEDLNGTLPPFGKQFLTTQRGVFRLALRANTDNTTEEAAHRRAGAELVQVFGTPGPRRAQRGWIGIDQLYARHGVPFDANILVDRVIARVRAAV